MKSGQVHNSSLHDGLLPVLATRDYAPQGLGRPSTNRFSGSRHVLIIRRYSIKSNSCWLQKKRSRRAIATFYVQWRQISERSCNNSGRPTDFYLQSELTRT